MARGKPKYGQGDWTLETRQVDVCPKGRWMDSGDPDGIFLDHMRGGEVLWSYFSRLQ